MSNELPDRPPQTPDGPVTPRELPGVVEDELEKSGRYRELAELLEAQLAADPPLAGTNAEAVRLRLVTVYEDQLRDQGRALAHLEALLSGDSIDAALPLAQHFLEQRSAGPRVAALLSDAYARLGRTMDEIATLTRELRLARLPRLAHVQRRLATLRQDVLGDVEGATELLEQLMARDPGDDEARRRFIVNSVDLNRSKEAANLLSRALRSAHEDTRARVGLDIALLHARDGDLERARRAFAQVLESDSDALTRLAAARHLLDLRSGLTPPKTLIRPLAVVAECDADAGARAAAASELLDLRSRVRLDAASEIAAWRALLDGPRTEEALAKLENLYEASGNKMGLSEVLERRAASEPDPAAAQTLALRSADLCGADADPEKALAAWQRYVARYGASRQAHARMIPLLERIKNFAELARVLADEIELTPEPQRGTSLGRLGEVRLRHLSDTRGALELFRRSLDLSPRESRSRGCLEELLGDPEWALPAADVLEPLYRSELSSSERARRMLTRVLSLRAEHAPHTDDRVRACTELGEILEAAGGRAEALTWYERAWSLDPKRTELLARVDALAEREGQTPEHRLERYIAAVERVEETGRRAELLRAIGALEHSRGDVSTAIATWRRALEAEPADFAIHEALFRTYGELGDSTAAMEELRRALPHFRGQERQITLVRMGEALARRGAHKEALDLCLPILEDATLDESVLPALEKFAESAEDVETGRVVFERAVRSSSGPEARAHALERFGEFLEGWPGDVDGAARCWKAAATEYLSLTGKAADALLLLERALDHSREDVEPAARLLELYVEAGEWSRLPEMYALLLRSEDPTPALELLLSLESSAVRAGAAIVFSELVENALWRLSDLTSPFKHPLIAARARVFASAGYHEEAAEVYHMLLELYADERDASDFQALIDSSPSWDWRRDNQRWLFEWRAEAAEDSVPLLIEWATIEETQFDDRQAAIAVWERAAVRDPSRVQIWEALVRLKIDNGDVEGGLDAVQPLRGLLSDEARLALELRIASTLIVRLDRADRAVPILASVLEKTPADAVARDLAFGIVRSGSPLGRRVGELLEQASSASDSPAAQSALLEQLLEATTVQSSDETQFANVRRRWLERLFELTTGEPSFAVAERAALEFSGDDAIWQRLELLSCQLGDPERAVRVYVQALDRSIPGDVAEMLGRRLLAFADERGQSPKTVTAALERVLELSPGARWAVDRVKMMLTTEQRWPALFALYERAAGAAADEAERADLFDEAAIAARDVVGDVDRAIDYWERVLRLRPGDTRVDLTLERLYEKQGQIAKLVPHLIRRAESYSGVQLRSMRERIAALWLDLSDAAAALEVIEALLTDDPGNETAYGLLERTFALGSQRAGELLKKRYAKVGRRADLVRVLERELDLVTSSSERIDRLKRLLEVHAELGASSSAFECLGELIALEPTVSAHRKRLTDFAAELGADARLAELFIAAADRASEPGVAHDLLRRAAAVRTERLSDADGAADLYLRILAGPYERPAQVDAARALRGLLEKIVQPGRRCNVLEQLATFETEPEAYRATVLEAARVALEELGDPARAVRDLQPLVETIPSNREVQNTLVRALRSAENYAELAGVLADRAAASESSDARRDLIELAHICAERLSKPDRAIDGWCEVRRRFGRDTESFEALSRLFEDREKWQELASLLLEEANACDSPRQLFARLGDVHRDHTLDVRAAVEAYISAGDPEKAFSALESDERLLSSDPSFCVRVAAALKGAGAFAKAESLLRRQLEHKGRRRTKDPSIVHLELADVLRAAGRENEAFEQLSTAAELLPTDPAILSALGRAALERGALERAEKIYLALLLLLRHSSDGRGTGLSRAEVYVELGELALRRDENDRARDLMSSALESALESEQDRLGLEQALRRRGRFDLLENALETQFARATHPTITARALATLVDFHRERGSLNDAKVTQLVERADHVRRDLGHAPTDMSEFDAFHKLVEVYVSLDHAERAIELLDVMSASAGAPDEGVPFALEAARLLVEVPFRRDEAATKLLAIWQRNGARADVANLLTRVLEEEGRIEEALAVYQSRPLERGRERETLEAIVRLEQALGADPSRIAGALERLLDFEQGERRADLARHLSVLYKEQGDSAAMERVLAVGFAADPARADLRDDLVASYVARGALTQAAATLERALETCSDASLRWRLSEVYQGAGDLDAALRAIDFVPASRSEKGQLGHRRFLVLEAAGRTEDALIELDAAYHIDNRYGAELLAAIQRTALAVSSERWALAAADLLARYGEPAKARQTLEGWLEANPTNRPALRRLAKLAAKERDFSTAIDAFQKLSRTETGEARKSAALELARVCVAAGRAGEALADLETALADAPTDVELCESVRKLYALAGARQKQARMVLDQASRTTASTARAALLLEATALFIEEGAWGEALDAAGQAATLDPQSAKAAVLASRILASRGERTKAIETLAKFAAAQNGRKSKDLAQVFKAMADLYLADDELVDALEALSQAHRLDKSDTEVAYLLGLVALDLDQVDVASAALRAFVATRNHVVKSTTRDEPTRVSRAYFHLAVIEHARGDEGAARRMVSRAMEESPSNGDARRLMDELRPSSWGN